MLPNGWAFFPRRLLHARVGRRRAGQASCPSKLLNERSAHRNDPLTRRGPWPSATPSQLLRGNAPCTLPLLCSRHEQTRPKLFLCCTQKTLFLSDTLSSKEVHAPLSYVNAQLLQNFFLWSNAEKQRRHVLSSKLRCQRPDWSKRSNLLTSPRKVLRDAASKTSLANPSVLEHRTAHLLQNATNFMFLSRKNQLRSE